MECVDDTLLCKLFLHEFKNRVWKKKCETLQKYFGTIHCTIPTIFLYAILYRSRGVFLPHMLVIFDCGLSISIIQISYYLLRFCSSLRNESFENYAEIFQLLDISLLYKN